MRKFLLATALLLAPTLAMADTPDVSKMKSDDCARARKQNKTCVLDMGKEDIEGGAPTATGTSVGIVSFGKAASLIRIRKDFIVEILKSAEDLD
jgi:hypothetical protein